MSLGIVSYLFSFMIRSDIYYIDELDSFINPPPPPPSEENQLMCIYTKAVGHLLPIMTTIRKMISWGGGLEVSVRLYWGNHNFLKSFLAGIHPFNAKTLK